MNLVVKKRFLLKNQNIAVTITRFLQVFFCTPLLMIQSVSFRTL